MKCTKLILSIRRKKKKLIQSVSFKFKPISEDTIKILQATYCSSVCSVKSVGRMLVIFLCITMDTVNWSEVKKNRNSAYV